MNSVKKCWDFGTSEDPSFPQIELKISSIDNDKYFSHSFKIDTGFNGTLGITSEIIRTVNLTPQGSILVNTAVGMKYMPYFPLKIMCEEINLKDSLIFAIATPRAISGRAFLKNRKWLLDFKSSKFCYCKD
ncbi:MAG: hypothetical protein ACTSO9_15145 [Candidatus Helarchaeota archaeon]